MSASLFGTSNSVNVNVNGTLVPQSFVGTAGQTLFTITNFTYTVSTNSLLVWINGQKQASGRDYVETSPTSFTLVEGVAAGDYVDVIGFPQINLTAVPPASITLGGTYTLADFVNDSAVNVQAYPYLALGNGISDDSAAIQAAENACALSGKSLYFPAGTYKCTIGIIKKSVNWKGDGINTSLLSYYGSDVLINATGTSGARVICTISSIGLVGTNAAATARGISIGWNQRCTLLDQVSISGFKHYGIHFNDQNWLVKLKDVQVAGCGGVTSNSAGIFKDPTIDSGTWNDIVFDTVIVEGCGSSSSAAGGFNLQTNTSNRGVYLLNCCAEGNFGADEIYITHIDELQITNFYIERTNVAGQLVGIDLEYCTGGIHGGFITAAGGASQRGLRALNCNLHIDAMNFGFWPSASIDCQNSKLYLGQNFTGQTGVVALLTYANLLVTGTSQITGIFAPRILINRSVANQALPNNTFTKVLFDTSENTVIGTYSAGTYTPGVPGMYQINVQVYLTASTVGDRPVIAVYKNGVSVRFSYVVSSSVGALTLTLCAPIVTISATDTLEIFVRQTTGAAQTISGSAADTWLSISYIGK